MKQKNKVKGITLIALVITIIILLIIAGVSIATLTGENGMLTKAQKAKEKEQKAQASEILKLKMTDCQMKSIDEKGKYPTLSYLAAFLDDDSEIAYVKKESQPIATLDEKPYVDWDKIYTKLEEYPYEFEINGSFQVAINGETIKDVIPEGYMKIPTETLDITKNGDGIDVTNYAKVNVNVPETTGKGIYWDSGYFDIVANNTYSINLDFNPSYVCFTNRTNGSSVIYNTKLNKDRQYINGTEYLLNKEGTTIISIGTSVVFRSSYNLTWDWIALP